MATIKLKFHSLPLNAIFYLDGEACRKTSHVAFTKLSEPMYGEFHIDPDQDRLILTAEERDRAGATPAVPPDDDPARLQATIDLLDRAVAKLEQRAAALGEENDALRGENAALKKALKASVAGGKKARTRSPAPASSVRASSARAPKAGSASRKARAA